MRKFLFLLIVLVAIGFGIRTAMAPAPTVELQPQVSVLGKATPLSVRANDKKGLRRVSVLIEQEGKKFPAFLVEPSKTTEGTWDFVAGSSKTPELHDGKAQLLVEAVSGGLLHKTTQITREVTVVTQPPTVSADSDTHYLYIGMADLATLNVSGSWTEAGVRVGDVKFRAWPMPGGKAGYFSLYAFPWNAPKDAIPVAFASNVAGNDVTTPLLVNFPKKEQPRYTIHNLEIPDSFIQKVVGELDPNGTGDMVARFVKINNEMRKSNNQTLSDLRTKTADHFLWSKPFQRQPGAATEATFADQRKYMYKGQKIDEQVHLGYDLAVTKNVGVQASNDGKVVYAAPLGIYGNCIVVDHGYGLQTIYGHLSRIDVKEGDMVKQGQVMGLSGMTGMAGGDHIHFSMQLDGVQIDPKEFWDSHWIQDHIANRVELPGFGK